MRPSETQMYDLLQCTQEWTIPYSQIYVEGEICCAKNSKAKSAHSHSRHIKYCSVVTPQTSLLKAFLWCSTLRSENSQGQGLIVGFFKLIYVRKLNYVNYALYLYVTRHK